MPAARQPLAIPLHWHEREGNIEDGGVTPFLPAESLRCLEAIHLGILLHMATSKLVRSVPPKAFPVGTTIDLWPPFERIPQSVPG